jgi:hypothetical protein
MIVNGLNNNKKKNKHTINFFCVFHVIGDAELIQVPGGLEIGLF